MMLTSCDLPNQEPVKLDGIEFYLANESGTNLVPVKVSLKSTNVKALIDETIQILQNGVEGQGGYATVPKEIEIHEIRLENKNVIINFGKWYKNMSVIQELICRSSIVKSITSIEGVESLEIYVDGIPLKNDNGILYGQMKADDIVINLDKDETENLTKRITLYFANEKGEKLVPVPTDIHLDSNEKLEKNIINALILGPEGITQSVTTIESVSSGVRRTLPENLTIKDIYTNQGVCYIDFPEEFISEPMEAGLTEKVVLYSIVNTLTDLPNIDKVQFLVEGKIADAYKGIVDFEQLFERDLEINE